MSRLTKWDSNGRICSRCFEYKEWDNFNWKRPPKNKEYVDKLHRQKQPQCRPCSNKITEDWRNKQSPERIKDLYYKRIYGISLDEFNTRLTTQKGLCLICSRKLTLEPLTKDSVVVDHCHSTGQVRGLLCNECNRGLGYFRDNQTALAKAIDYLKGNYDALYEKG